MTCPPIRLLVATLALLAVAVSPARAQPAASDCSGPAGWQRPSALTASANADGHEPLLAAGRAARVGLRPSAELHLPPGARPAREGAGGVLAFTAPSSGIYRVMLDGRAWIDVLRDGVSLASLAHAHGPSCGPVRKMVDFQLSAGRYLVVLGGSDRAALTVLVARRP